MKAYVSVTAPFADDELVRKLKIALLWFDQISIQSFGKSCYPGYLTEEYNLSKDNEKELELIFKDIVGDINIYDSNLIDRDLFERLNKAVKENLRLKNDDLYDLKTAFIASNCLGYCFEKWKSLNVDEPYAFIGADYEKEVLKTLLDDAQDRNNTCITENLEILLPSVDELSFDKILELREHRYLKNFRETINNLIRTIGEKDIEEVKQLKDDLINQSTKEVFKLIEPCPSKQIIKGVASNIPLPIPVNPVSVASSCADVGKDIMLERKYGWLFFYMENLL